MNIKKITFIYENCEFVYLNAEKIVSIDFSSNTKERIIVDKNKCKNNTFKNKISVKVVLEKNKHSLTLSRKDVAQISIEFDNGVSRHYSLNWGVNDCGWTTSSLQKFEAKEDVIIWSSDY